MTIQVFGVHGRIGRCGAARTEALPLDGTGGEGSFGDVDAGFAGWPLELLETDGGDFDMHVDSVEERAGDARPVALDGLGGAGALMPRIP